MLTRKEREAVEDKFLAPYAMRSRDSGGRVHKEAEHLYRTVYQRDRDRVVHSAAFRRLEYKTQVFVNHEGDYYRTRLTHTLEVSQIARTIARSLRLNEDLVEAVALAHDLGHTPYGHAGEEALNELMNGHGGFEHNRQTLRVVDKLEERYPDFKGLNLTWEVREGLAKHSGKYDRPITIPGFGQRRQPTLEAQVVNIADEIAYDNHDLDDGVTSKLLDFNQLSRVTLWAEAASFLKGRFARLEGEVFKYQVIRHLIDIQISDLISQTQENITRCKIRTVKDAGALPHPVVAFSRLLQAKRRQLKDFLLDNLYKHYRVIRMSSKAKRFIKQLFAVYLSDIRQLPPEYQKRFKSDGKYQIVCDYIAGMTDRSVENEYKKLFEPFEKV
ncbi:MAG: deoxyguanosinetriphosphate triphosphohydrolase [Candidatus Omnitrophota bacterium]